MANINITCFPGVFVSDDEVRMRNRFARFISIDIFGKKIIGLVRAELLIIRRLDAQGDEVYTHCEYFKNMELVFDSPIDVKIDLEKLFKGEICDDEECEMDMDRYLGENIFWWETRFEEEPVSLEKMLEHNVISGSDYKKIVNAVAKELKFNKIKGE